MRLATCVLGAALLVLGARPGRALADDTAAPASYRAVVDRVELEPSSIGGLRLRIELSALALQGQLLDLSDPKSIKLMIGNSKLEAPYALGVYGATGADTAIAFVVQANQAYAEALPTILTSLDDNVLSKLGDHTLVAMLAYGDATEAGKLGTLKAARAKLGTIAPDTSTAEPALLDTLDRALRLLRSAKPKRDGAPIRKIIVVIGDGRDRAGDRERVTQLGTRAAKDGIRIHSLGFAPSNVRRPLLTLGELSKRSLGTFRWVRTGTAESWGPALQQLRDEIGRQYVLTYFLPEDSDVAGKRLKIVTVGRTEATSNEVKIPEALCGREACAGYCVDEICAIPHVTNHRGLLGWLLLIAGAAIGVLAVLVGIGFVLQKRSGAQVPGQMPGQVPGQPPMPGQPPAAMGWPGAAAPPAGKKSRKAKRPVQATPPPAPTVGPALLIMTGPRAGQRIPLFHGFLIGKAPNAHLVLDDGYTSTHHAQIVLDQAGTCRLYDSGSTNGTFVNGVRVTDVALDHGMSIRIGSIELRFLAQ